MASRSFVVSTPGHAYVAATPHPIDGFLLDQGDGTYGGWWTDDYFTFQLIRDGVLQRTAAQDQQVDSLPPEGLFD